MTQEMTPKMKTVCVGRFLIDLPEGADVEFTPARVAGVDVNVRPGYTDEKLKGEIAQREQELSQQENDFGRPSLEKKIEAEALNFKTTMMYYERQKPITWFELGKKVSGTEEAISIEAFGLYESLLFHLKAEHLSSPKRENNVLNLVKKIEARSTGVIPTQPGFCMENGMIHDPIPAGDDESIAMFASLKGHPDVAIRLHMIVNHDRIEESLLVRDANSDVKTQYPNRIKNLRRQHRPLNGIEGDETASKYKEDNGSSAHAFMWFAPGKAQDVLAPQLSLELETGIGRPGEPVNSSLSDGEVIELWDRITQSIRLRSTNAAVPSNTGAANPKVALGELVATGRRCPQTGYWQCDASGAVEGSSKKFFQEGVAMPKAIVHGIPNIWQKISGGFQLHHVSTLWKLVAYGVEPAGVSSTDGSQTPGQVRSTSDSDNHET